MTAVDPIATAVRGWLSADFGASWLTEKLSSSATMSAVIALANTAGTDSGPGRTNCKAIAIAVATRTAIIIRLRRRTGSRVIAAATASAARTVSINQVTPDIRSAP